VAIIYLPRELPHEVKRHTRRFFRCGSHQCACLALLPVGFAWPATSLPPPVVSYTTLSPLPRLREAVCFLLHLPSGHPAWLLASTVPCGGRTFLGWDRTSCDRHPRRSSGWHGPTAIARSAWAHR